jgi:hypothetical protein
LRASALKPHTSASGAARRSAFTLLEVLFALGLSMVLMGAVLAAVDLYRSVTVAGRDEVETAQLTRAIFKQMELDIRSTTFGLPVPESDEEGADATEESAEETIVASVDPAEAYAGQSIGIFGDATTLIIHGHRPTRRVDSLLLAASGMTGLSGSDLKSIAYFIALPGSEGLQGAAGDLFAAQSGREAQGLARLEGDRLSLEFADVTSDLQTMAANSVLLAEEVTFLQFRYFDGIDWYDVWDSVSLERLPNAIEITIGFRQSSSTPSEDVAESGDISRSHLHRFVVSVPAAEHPALSASSQSF